MIVFKRHHLLLLPLFIGLCSSSLSLLATSPPASAVSAYDNVIAQGQNVVKNCAGSDRDLRTSYAGIISGQTGSERDTFMGYFNAALAAGTGWAVSQWDNDAGYTDVTLFVSTVPGTEQAYFLTSGGTDSLMAHHIVRATIDCNGESGGEPVWAVNFNNGNTNRDIAYQSTGNNERPVFINMDIDYPSDYEGIHPLTTDTPSPPDFSATLRVDSVVSDKHIVSTTPANTAYPSDTVCVWYLYNDIANHGTKTVLPCSDPFVKDVTVYGRYWVELYLQSEPSLHTYPDIFYGNTIDNFNVDGTFFNSTNTLDVSTQESDYTDCSTINALTDIGGYVGCQVHNLGFFIRDSFKLLFIPTQSDLAGVFSQFTTDTFGIGAVVAQPLSFLNQIANPGACAPIVIPLPYMQDKSLTLPCMYSFYSDNLGSFFTVYQVISTGVIAYWVAIQSLGVVKKLKDPQDDGIEVFKL